MKKIKKKELARQPTEKQRAWLAVLRGCDAIAIAYNPSLSGASTIYRAGADKWLLHGVDICAHACMLATVCGMPPKRCVESAVEEQAG